MERYKSVAKSAGFKYLLRRARLTFEYHGIGTRKFHSSLFNYLNILKELEVTATFPIVASVASRNTEIINLLVKEGHEIASHGLIHIDFKSIPYEEQLLHLRVSSSMLKNLGVEVHGVRTPYTSYSANTLMAIAEAGYRYDSSLYYPKPMSPQLVRKGDKEICEIYNTLTDVVLDIDTERGSPGRMLDYWMKTLSLCKKGEVVTIDAHPVRMGTKRHDEILKIIIQYAKKKGFLVTNLRNVVELFMKNELQAPVLALVADIDCLSVADYFLRFFKKA